MDINQFLLANQWVILLIGIWSIVWKGLALWKSARAGEKYWFIILLVVNFFGLLEILYLYLFSREDFRRGFFKLFGRGTEAPVTIKKTSKKR